ncbi:MAG: right-handed parallel beta-helix repeat-containing protein [Phycisphaerales bacterium]
MRFRILTTLAAASLASAAVAGDLTPPGAPAPSMKTLDQVEPRVPLGSLTTPGDADSVYRITKPGSYYLTDDINLTFGKRGVEIASGNVTLDLAGFVIRATQNGTLDGVAVVSGTTLPNISVGNGAVENVDGAGVDLFSSEASIIHDMRISSVAGDGVRAGFAGTIERVHIREGAGDAFDLTNFTTLRDCFARDNAGHGFVGSMNATRCVAERNGGSGFVGGGTLMSCTSYLNGGNGFYFSSPTAIENSIAGRNTENGFVAAIDVVVATNCSADRNEEAGFYGISGGAWVATNCSATDNIEEGFWGNPETVLTSCSSSGNGSHGYYLRAGMVQSSVSSSNGGDGVRVFSTFAVTVRDCTIEDNSGFGVILTTEADNSLIAGNRISGHRTAGVGVGIRIEGNANAVHIDGNYTNENLVGIQVLTAGNTIINNRMSDNINAPISVVAGNDVAPLSSAAAATSPVANIFN